jgi:hypothetical protein
MKTPPPELQNARFLSESISIKYDAPKGQLPTKRTFSESYLEIDHSSQCSVISEPIKLEHNVRMIIGKYMIGVFILIWLFLDCGFIVMIVHFSCHRA